MKHFTGNIVQPSYAMEWRVCERFPNYEVSVFGDLRYCRETTMRSIGDPVAAHIGSGGYVVYTIPDLDKVMRSVSAHQLVAEAFIGPRPGPGYEVAHRSGSKISAYAPDLRWSTRAGNNVDKITHGTSLKGRKNGRAKLTEEDVLEIRRAYIRIKSRPPRTSRREYLDLAKRFNITEKNLDFIGTGYTWKHLPLDPDNP